MSCAAGSSWQAGARRTRTRPCRRDGRGSSGSGPSPSATWRSSHRRARRGSARRRPARVHDVPRAGRGADRAAWPGPVQGVDARSERGQGPQMRKCDWLVIRRGRGGHEDLLLVDGVGHTRAPEHFLERIFGLEVVRVELGRRPLRSPPVEALRLVLVRLLLEVVSPLQGDQTVVRPHTLEIRLQPWESRVVGVDAEVGAEATDLTEDRRAVRRYRIVAGSSWSPRPGAPDLHVSRPLDITDSPRLMRSLDQSVGAENRRSVRRCRLRRPDVIDSDEPIWRGPGPPAATLSAAFDRDYRATP